MDFINNINIAKSYKEKIKEANKKVKKLYPESLYDHSIATLNYSLKLADIYLKDNISDDDLYKMCLAVILHDYGKLFGYDILKEKALKNKNRIIVEEGDFDIKPLLHGFGGAFIVEEEFNIKDPQIINSIIYHSTGYEGMSLTDKIIYISDKIEETREFNNINFLREISIKNINLCLLEVYKNNIIYIINNNKCFYSKTLNIWNYICKLYGGFLYVC